MSDIEYEFIDEIIVNVADNITDWDDFVKTFDDVFGKGSVKRPSTKEMMEFLIEEFDLEGRYDEALENVKNTLMSNYGSEYLCDLVYDTYMTLKKRSLKSNTTDYDYIEKTVDYFDYGHDSL